MEFATRNLWVLLLSLLLGVASGCGALASREDGEQQLQVVAATSIVADWVKEVGGERVAVTSLVPANVDAHTFEPTPTDVARVAKARIVFYNGLGLEGWLDTLIKSARGERLVVVVSEGIKPLKAMPEEVRGSLDIRPDGTQQDTAASERPDPHFWHDVRLAAQAVATIRDALVQADPLGKSEYEQHAKEYLQRLEELDQWVQREVETLPPERRKLVTNHETFQYFARRYGFQRVGSIVPGGSSDREPSAQEAAELIGRIRQEAVPAIFAENIANTKLAEAIAQEAGVRVVTGLYTDALGDAGSEGETYEKMVRFNVKTIVEALR